MAQITGTSGNNNMWGTIFGDKIEGLGGNDTIDGGGGGDEMYGGDGDDVINFDWNDDIVAGGEDDDTLIGWTNGTVGSSVLSLVSGGAGIDTLEAAVWDDDYGIGLLPGESNEYCPQLVANLTTNTATFSYVRETFYNVTTETYTVDLDGIENLTGGKYDDDLTGDEGSNTIDGGSGSDEINGEGGDDYLIGGVDGPRVFGSDTLNGGTGDDTLDGGHFLSGDSGDDLIIQDGYNSTVSGGSGIDTLELSGWYTNSLLGEAGSITGVEIIHLLLQSNVDLAKPLGNSVEGGLLTVIGSSSDDRIDGSRIDAGVSLALHGGSGGDDELTGGDGDDTLQGITGNDTLDGGAGNDTLEGSTGDDSLVGGTGNDLFKGGSGADDMNGWFGTDRADYSSEGFVAASGPSFIIDLSTGEGSAGAAGDTYAGIENVTGSSFDDRIIGNTAGNVLDGGGGFDVLSGKDGSDTLNGGAANDTLDGGSGNDLIDGGTGRDTLQMTEATTSLTVVFAEGGLDGSASGLGTDVIRNMENAALGSAGDTFTGNNAANFVKGGGGSDALVGGGGNDTLAGDVGDDTLIGGAGNDSLYGHAGNDTLQGSAGNDSMDGGTKIDRVTYLLATSAITGDLATGVFTGEGNDTVTGVEYITGSVFDDRFKGNGSANHMLGGAGQDLLIGRGGADTLIGGIGDDNIDGGQGDDLLDGGSGSDWAQFLSASTAVTVALGEPGSDGSATGHGTDVLRGIENVYGSSQGDTVTGNSEANFLKGGGGHDALFGSGGNDSLRGMDDNDTLSGGLGEDALDGGTGTDTADYSAATNAVTVDLSLAGAQDTGEGLDTLVSIENVTGSPFGDTLTGSGDANILRGLAGLDSMTGNGGNDVFDFNDVGESGNTNTTADVIIGFVSDEDKIDLGGIDAIAGGDDNEAFIFVDDADFSALGQVRVIEFGGDTYVRLNTSGGNTSIEMAIKLEGTGLGIVASDFIL